MQLIRRINIPLLLGASVLVGILTVVSFVFAWAKDEGTMGSGFFKNMLADSFSIFRFPTHVLFWGFFSSSAQSFFVGLTMNCLFWGLIIERSFWLIKKWRASAW
jgi:hypothetical protein